MKSFIYVLIVLLFTSCTAAEKSAENSLAGKWESYQIIGDRGLSSDNFSMVLEIDTKGAVKINATASFGGRVQQERDTGSIEGYHLKFHGKKTRGRWKLSGDTLELMDEKRNTTIRFRRSGSVE